MSLRRKMEDGIERDIRDHIEIETEENIDRGMSPADARGAALRKFGNAALAAEDTRAVWRWMWLDRLAQDARYALRGLRRNPLFAAVAILTLALGIGLNTAVFSVVSAVLIKPLSYPGPNRIVWLANLNRRFHFEASSGPDFADWRDQATSFEAMAGYGTVDGTVEDGDQSAKHSFVFITPEFWRISGAHAALGRLFTGSDRNVVVLTWRMFQQRFGGDRRALGRVVLVDGRPTTIIGVLPDGFRFFPPTPMAGGMSGEAEAFTPNIITTALRTRGPAVMVMFVVAKLKPGVTIEQARAELQTIQSRIARANPQGFYRGLALRVMPLQERLVGESRRALLIMLAAVAFVLLIACANLGSLLLARATARRREIAIRAAIGAGRNRLLRQFLVEGLTLSLLGGALGVGLARAADGLLIRLSPASVPRLGEIAIDWRVLLFTLGISSLAGLAFGLAPVLSVSAGTLHSVLKEGGRGSSGSAAGLAFRRILVAAELAMALVLLAGAGLMVKSFARMYAHPAWFQPEKIGLLKVFLAGPAYRDAQNGATDAYAQRALAAAGRVPGVETAALTQAAATGVVEFEGTPRFPPGQAPQVIFRAASAAYPQVIGLPLLKGRWTTDDEPAPAIMVNETFARLAFGRDNPLGQRVSYFNRPAATIVGVVGDLKTSRLDADPAPEFLVPYKELAHRRIDILFKTAGDVRAILPEVRRAIQHIDPSQPPYGVTTMEDALAESIAPRRFNLLLLGTFAAAAVLLALIGLYGVMAYAVEQRTHEIGVRMALGARRMEVVRMVMRQGMTVALAGIVAGAAAALGLTRLISTLLFDVQPDDPWVFTAVAAILLATALAASGLPALQAARVDPLAALRYE